MILIFESINTGKFVFCVYSVRVIPSERQLQLLQYNF